MSDLEDRVAAIDAALRVLSKGRAIRREDDELVVLLLDDKKLGILRDIWGIHLELGAQAARVTIGTAIASSMAQIRSRAYASRELNARSLTANEREQQFRRVVAAVFNMLPGDDLKQMDQTRRFAWLGHNDRGDLKINKDAAREDFYHAVDRIARHYATTVPTAQASVPDSEPGEVAAHSDPRKPGDRKRALVLSASAVVVVLGGVIAGVAFANSGDSDAGNQAPTSTSSKSQSSVATDASKTTEPPIEERSDLATIPGLLMSFDNGFSTVFSADEKSDADYFRSRYQGAGVDWFKLFAEALDAGAFSHQV